MGRVSAALLPNKANQQITTQHHLRAWHHLGKAWAAAARSPSKRLQESESTPTNSRRVSLTPGGSRNSGRRQESAGSVLDLTARDGDDSRCLAAELDQVQTTPDVRNFGKTDKFGAQSNIHMLRWYLLGRVGFVMNVDKIKPSPELDNLELCERLRQRYQAALQDFATSYVTNMMDPAGGAKDRPGWMAICPGWQRYIVYWNSLCLTIITSCGYHSP